MSQNIRDPDKTIPWALLFWILIPLALVVIAQWGLWSFLLGVFGP